MKEFASGDIIIIVLYVDDLIITGHSMDKISNIKLSLQNTFEMTDLGFLHYFLGIQVWQKDDGFYLSQTKYALDILKRFQVTDCKSVSTPIASGLKLSKDMEGEDVDPTLYRQLVGSLVYLTHTRPDISFAVSVVSRFLSSPKVPHWIAAKRILRYVKGTLTMGIYYSFHGDISLIGYLDSDWAGSVDDRKSTIGYVVYLGAGPISWCSKKQSTIALSTTEAEYTMANEAAKEITWLRAILSVLKQHHAGPSLLHCDNQSAISLSKNLVFHARSKHIEVYHHYIRHLLQQQVIHLQYCKTEDQIADLFTKALSEAKFVSLRHLLGLRAVT